MSAHSLFSPSKSAMWLNCPGAMAFSENREQGGSSTYADDGTATHTWAADALFGRQKCFLNPLTINGKEYHCDEERASRIQGYVADVHRRAIGGHLFIEKKVDLSDYLGEGQGGTADVAIALPAKRLGIIEDLKDGSGEKVWASYLVKPATDSTPEVRAPNPQLALYALGMLPELALFGPIDNMLLVIYQPKLDHVDEFPVSVADLLAFGELVKAAVAQATASIVSGDDGLTTAGYLNPGEKQCRWCRAKARCPALTKFVQDETQSDFEEMIPFAPPDTGAALAKAYASLPLIELWADAVRAETHAKVAAGEKLIGPDGQPYKFVEGKEGSRKWLDEKAAEAALAGQLGPKAYSEPKLLTAPAAAKLLDKKATKAMWRDVFEPLISRAPGKPVLAMGSDQRPAVTPAAEADDFEDELAQ